MNSVVHNLDCMIGMAQFPDKYFDLAVVDPPYGIGVTNMTLGNGKRKINRGSSEWDNAIPDKNYYEAAEKRYQQFISQLTIPF